MKRLLAIVTVCIMLLGLCACSVSDVNRNEEVALIFIYGEENIRQTLTDEEADKVIEILDGKEYSSIMEGTPSCGFSKDISFSVEGRKYMIARDSCNVIMEHGTYRNFSVSKEEIRYIHSLFKKYGGYFPCV